jgi:hypothetical protein
MDAWMLVASADATAGSVMVKQERMRPSSSGSSHRACCSGVPYRASTCSGRRALGLELHRVEIKAFTACSACRMVA